MKKTSKIIVSIYLVSSILTLSVAPALAFSASQPIDYVAFGDSVAAGVRGGVKETGSNFGYTDNLAGFLRNSGVLSSFNEDFCTSGMTAKALAAKTATLNDTSSTGYNLVRKAEIATLTIGANDLLAPLYAYIGTLKSTSSVDTAKMKALLNTVTRQIYDGTTAPAIQANIEAILQNIFNANPNIKIYVMGYYNPLPLASAMASVDLTTPLKDFNVYIQKAVSNVAAKNAGSSITFVDTMSAISADSLNNLVMSDIHPTPTGYKVIAAEFWKQVKVNVDGAVTAAPTKSAVLINGKSVAFEAYNINNSNYFKLRDIAMALNGTVKQFGVNWDSQKNSIVISAKSVYTAVGGELTSSGNTASLGTAKTTTSLYLNGKAICLTAYNIGGYNYIKLRDMASAINFGIGWNEGTSTISIDTAAGYST